MTGKSIHIPNGIIMLDTIPDSKVHGANMGPTWVLSTPDEPHIGPLSLAIRNGIKWDTCRWLPSTMLPSNWLFGFRLNTNVGFVLIKNCIAKYNGKLFTSDLHRVDECRIGSVCRVQCGHSHESNNLPEALRGTCHCDLGFIATAIGDRFNYWALCIVNAKSMVMFV